MVGMGVLVLEDVTFEGIGVFADCFLRREGIVGVSYFFAHVECGFITNILHKSIDYYSKLVFQASPSQF